MKFQGCSLSLASLAAIGSAALLAVAPSVVTAASLETCPQQAKCLKFNVTKVQGAPCGIGADACPVRVCMKFDLDAPGCIKGSRDTVSHACDNAKADLCVRPEAWMHGSGFGTSVDAGVNGACTSTGSNTRCEDIPDEYEMCQIGKPNDILYFTVYVARAIGRIVHSFVRRVRDSLTYTKHCPPQLPSSCSKDGNSASAPGTFVQTVASTNSCGGAVDVPLNLMCTEAVAAGKCCNPEYVISERAIVNQK
jgi:hypothetical protein